MNDLSERPAVRMDLSLRAAKLRSSEGDEVWVVLTREDSGAFHGHPAGWAPECPELTWPRSFWERVPSEDV